MLVYNKKSGSKVVHYSNCRHVTGLKETAGRAYFDSLEEAKAAGYRLCKCCAPMTKFYRKEAKALETFAAENGLSYRYEDGMLDIQSPYSQWKVIVGGRNNRMLFIYHKNTQPRKKQKPSPIPGYHSQAYRTDTLLGYMKFVLSHDAYHLEHNGPWYAYPREVQEVVMFAPPFPPKPAKKKQKKSKPPHTKRQIRAQKRGNRLSCVGKVHALIEQERRKREALELAEQELEAQEYLAQAAYF